MVDNSGTASASPPVIDAGDADEPSTDRRRPQVGQLVTVRAPATGQEVVGPRPFEVTALRPFLVELAPHGERPAWTLVEGMPVLLLLPTDRAHVGVECLVQEQRPDGTLLLRLAELVEQRRHPRHHGHVMVELDLLSRGGPDGLVSAESVDISAAGLRVRTSRPLTVGQRMFVTLPLPGQAPVQAIADVVGDSSPAPDGRFDTGLHFTTISEDTRGRLVLHLAHA